MRPKSYWIKNTRFGLLALHGFSARHGNSGGSVSRAAAGAIRIGNTVGAAFTNRRVIDAVEARIMLTGVVCFWRWRPSSASFRKLWPIRLL